MDFEVIEALLPEDFQTGLLMVSVSPRPVTIQRKQKALAVKKNHQAIWQRPRI